MVKIQKANKVPGGLGGFFAITVGTLTVIFLLVNASSSPSSAELSDSSQFLQTATTEFVVASNSQAVKAWRASQISACNAASTSKEYKGLEQSSLEVFKVPKNPPPQPRNKKSVKRCRNVVMDFGANIGDTSGMVIDSGMKVCERKDGEKSKFMHYDIETKQFTHIDRPNMLVQNIQKLIEMRGESTGPEDYCYYGVEGNPHFTDRLRKIEDHVMAIRPRPIEHMHFFTESVGAGEDGPTKLYLDTINTNQNFWGSSIFKDHQDVRKSAVDGDAETVAAPVMGYTIGTLMRQTLTAFDENKTEKSHLILKVDIEGGEYPLLHQAVEEGTLCEFVKKGHTADLFIEFHSQRVTGRHDYVGKTKSMKDTLTACGVTFRNLEAWWH